MDLTQREGNYPVPKDGGKILGVEFSGFIVEMGSRLEDADEDETFKVADEVFGLAYGGNATERNTNSPTTQPPFFCINPFVRMYSAYLPTDAGAYAEFVAVSTRTLIHKPASLSWEVAAGVPETWTTALQAMYLVADFAPGRSILWHAGASSVSIAGIQLSKALGASAVYATVGSKEKVDFVTEALGADEAWDYNQAEWAEKVMGATDETGVDIIVDFVGQSYFQRNLDSVAVEGQVVIMGLLSGSVVPAGLDISAFVRKRVRVQGSRLRSRGIEYQEKLRDMLVERVLPGLVDGNLKVPIERVLDWRSIQEAHELMESNAIKGKLFVGWCDRGALMQRVQG